MMSGSRSEDPNIELVPTIRPLPFLAPGHSRYFAVPFESVLLRVKGLVDPYVNGNAPVQSSRLIRLPNVFQCLILCQTKLTPT